MRSILAAVIVFMLAQLPAEAQTESLEYPPVLRLQQKLQMINRATPTADELKITKEQFIKLAGLREEVSIFIKDHSSDDPGTRQKAETDFVGRMQPELQNILDENQLRRLDELHLQQEGAAALLYPEVIRKLSLTAAQQYRIQDARSDYGRTANFGLNPDFGIACFALLTDTQRATWAELIGEPSTLIRPRAPLIPGTLGEPSPVIVDRMGATNFFRIANPIIKADVQLTDDQFAKLTEANDRMNEASRELLKIRKASGGALGGPGRPNDELRSTLRKAAEATKAYQAVFQDVLTDFQKKRLREIDFQFAAENSILSREFRREAGLTDDQVNALHALIRPRMTRTRELAGPTVEKQREHHAFRHETVEQALKLFTGEQRDAWDKKCGKLVPIDGWLTAKD